MRKSAKTTLSKYLKQAPKTELEKEIKMLYDKFPIVKQYYQAAFSKDNTTILDEYKKKIYKEYFPTRGYGKARNNVSRKVITEFKKIATSKKDVIELILYRVEIMLKFTNTYGDIHEAFYNSMTRSFDEACKLTKKEHLEHEFQIECSDLIDKAYNFGWGVHDAMVYSYEFYFGPDRHF